MPHVNREQEDYHSEYLAKHPNYSERQRVINRKNYYAKTQQQEHQTLAHAEVQTDNQAPDVPLSCLIFTYVLIAVIIVAFITVIFSSNWRGDK